MARTALAIAVASCFASPAAFANPTGPAVVNGTASIIQNGNLLQITNSPNAIINWQSFSIGANEITRFLQQSASSAVLNRVVTQDPSSILGALQSNGRVFLINPNGITFGAGSQVDVAGLVASSLNLSNEDFLAGRMRFTEVPGAGSVVNQGNITTGSGGNVYLVGPAVTNSGIITSPQGEVILAAGNSVELVNPGTPNLRVEIAATDNQAVNLGQVIADAGRIGIYAGLVNNSGTIRADSAVAEGGRILLKATKSATLVAGSMTTASGASGGSVTVQSGGTTLVAGTVEAKGLGSPPAGGGVAPAGDGVVGEGGTIQVLGNLVGVIDTANLDASGESGGGTVLVGGDFQGRNPDVQNAFRTYVGSDTTIKADAISSGDGGKVVVWSDDATRASGTISARGGARSGNGGFVEVSGKNILSFAAKVNTSAPNGSAGTLLLDPQEIVVHDTTGASDDQLNADLPTTGDPAGSIYFADGGNVTFTVTDEALEAQTGNIVLQATRDITVNSGLSGGLNLTNQGLGERVVFQAGRDITIGSPLSTSGAAIWLEADSPHQPGGPDGMGLVNIQAPVSSNGGKITLIGGGNSNPQGGFKLDADINAGAGGIDIALSNAGTLNFYIGAGGNTQLSSNDTGSLKTSGALVLGRATTAGDNGLGLNAQVLTVDQLTNETASPIQLSADSGSSFELYATSSILLDRPLTTFQETVINTSTLTVNQTLATSNNNLTLNVSDVVLGPSGSINIGTGICSPALLCASLNVITSQNVWTGLSLTDSTNWFDATNWSGGVPDAADEVTIDVGFGLINISGGPAEAKSLVALSPVQLSSGSLSLSNASTFSNSLTLSSGGSLQGAGIVSVSSPTGALTWNGGSMASGGTFLLAGSGTLSGSLTLDRLFENEGLLTLSGATITGSGSIGNGSTINSGALTVSGSNAVNKMLLASGTIGGSGSLVVADWSRTGGTFDMTGTADLRVPSGNFSVDQAYTAGNLTLQAQAGDIILNAPVTGTASSGTTVTLVADNNFTNNFGSTAIDAGAGRFLVYSTDPASDYRGGLTYDFKQYNATFGVTTPAQGTGNAFLYSIAPTITPSLIGTTTKVYDGTAAATLAGANYATSGAIDGDTVVLNNPASGTYADRNVGSGKSVSTSGVAIASATDGSGASVFGYQLSSTIATGNVGEITARPITVTAVSDTKVYDATTSSVGTPLVSGGLGAGDTAAFVQSFDTKNVGTRKTLSASGAVTDGNGGANYLVSFVTDTTGVITPASLTISGVTANDKIYDTTTVATLNTSSAALGGVFGGDTVTLNSASASGAFTDKNAGTAKPVTAAGFGIGGTDAGNYTVAQPTGLTADITPATLTYAANTASRERGDPNPIFGGSVSGFVGGETLVTATSGTLSFTSPATQSSVEGQYAIDGGGLTANNGNYVFVQAPGNATALTISAPVNFLWTGGTGGAWETGSNWNKGFAPVNGAVVTIPDIGAAGVSDTVTYSIGTTNARTVTSAETLVVAGGTLNLGMSPADVSSFPQLILNGGTLAGAGTINVGTLSMLAGSVLSGTGVINGYVNNTAGTVAPGASPGVLTINGDYVQGSGGMLAVEIAGTSAGTQYDQLVVNGNATLGGTLGVTLVNGFVPSVGETFTAIQSNGGTVAGAFAATNYPTAPSLTTIYLSSAVNVAASAVLPPTDSQIVIVATDQSSTFDISQEIIERTRAAQEQQTLASQQIGQEQSSGPEQQQEKKKLPVCGGSSSGGGGATGVSISGGGGFGGRCTTRGCF